MTETKKPRRSREEIAAARAEVGTRLRSFCEARVGKPCPHACTKRCERKVREAKAKEARAKRLEEKRKALEQSIDQRTKARIEAEAARVAEVRFEERNRKSLDLALEKWQVQVLYLVGYSTDEITAKLSTGKSRRGPIGRVIKTGALVTLRADRKATVSRLVDLDRKAPHGYAGYVDASAARAPTKGILDDIRRVRDIVPEFAPVIEHTRLGERHYNAGTGASALQVLARGGAIREWSLQAGLMLAHHFQRMQGGGIGTIDYTKDIVDSSGSSNEISLSVVQASQKYRAAQDAVTKAFAIEGTSSWRWSVIDHVVLKDRPMKELAIPTSVTTQPALFLSDALEAVAIAFNIAPAGIGLREPTDEARARNLLQVAMRAHREAKIERN